MFHLKSLRARMTATVVVSFAVWMLLVCVAMMSYSFHQARRNSRIALLTTAASLRQDLMEHLQDPPDTHVPPIRANGTPRILANLIEAHREELITNRLALAVVDIHGHIVARSQQVVPAWPTETDQHEWRIKVVKVGSYTLVLGKDWEETENFLTRQAVLLFGLSFAVVIAVGFGSWVIVGRTLSPIGALSRQAMDASTEHLRLQLHAPSHDAEMVKLVDTLNGLLARLAETAAAKGRFYAAASHELRTPLQALSGHLEVALSRSRSAEDYRETLEEAYSQTRRLTSLVRDLLLLNQLDAAAAPPPEETVSIAEICERVLRHMQPIVKERELHLDVQLPVDGEISAPPMHAEMLVRNVIENAVKYAQPAGIVRIVLAEDTNGVRLKIYNACPPIPAWNPDALFEPFYRLDASRNAKTGGNGLGLAICKAITTVNGWHIALDHDGTGVTAVVEIPR